MEDFIKEYVEQALDKEYFKKFSTDSKGANGGLGTPSGTH